MPDPTTTHRITTAVLPEWAEAATGDARDAEIARLRDENCALVCHNGDLEAERGNLRSALGTIHAIATTGFREIDESLPRYWFERIQGIAAEATSPPKEQS